MNCFELHKDIDHVLITEEELDEANTRLAALIDQAQQGRDGQLVLLGVLKGSLVFLADLIRKLRTPIELDFVKASSYGASTVSTGQLKISLDYDRKEAENVDIIIIEDIIDSGNTLPKLVKHLKEKGFRSVRTCTLLDKPTRRMVDFQADYVGIVVPDEFVVGYGLDYDEKYRELPYIGVLKEEVYK